LKEIGQMYGITRERVRQIEERTLFKLRHLQITEELRDFLAD
ncbi:MAG: sigma factor-like helix-turn-helix DNA-binding protein, partial [Nitrospinota bacterium]